MMSLRDYIIEQLSYSKVLEQAQRLKDFREKIHGHFTQILQNWALIEASRLFGKNEQTVNHWKEELLTQCDEFIDTELKSGNKKKTLEKLLIDGLEYDNPDNVYKKIFKKFEKENLTKQQAKEIANILAERIEEVINVISSDYADEWVEKL